MVAVQVFDSPGGLAAVLGQMRRLVSILGILYAFLGTSGKDALVVFKVEDLEKACNTFKQKGIKSIDEKQLYEL